MRVAGMGGLSQTKRHGDPVRPIPEDVLAVAAELEDF
jgi:hypothetical protein